MNTGEVIVQYCFPEWAREGSGFSRLTGATSAAIETTDASLVVDVLAQAEEELHLKEHVPSQYQLSDRIATETGLSAKNPPESTEVEWLNGTFGVRSDRSLYYVGNWLVGLTVGDLDRACAAGYVAGDSRRIVITPSEGRGGGDGPAFAILDYLAANGVDLLFSVAGGGLMTYLWLLVPKKFKHAHLQRRARQAAVHWIENDLHSPWTLTKWLGTKSEWTVSELSAALRIAHSSSTELLLATGHARRRGTNTWTIGASAVAKARRELWDQSAESLYATDEAESRAWSDSEAPFCGRCGTATRPTVVDLARTWQCPVCGWITV